jgi:hypothetical protein
MKKTVNILSLSAIAFLFTVLVYSCSKDSMGSATVPAGQQDVSLYLTDAPGFFDKVLVDIRSVQVLVDTCSSRRNNFHDTCNVWEPLNITPGIYDLLTLRNGTDTLLAGATIPAGNISFIKIQLGPNDSLVKDSVSYPLQLRDSSVILVDVHRNRWDEFRPGRFRLWLDFDVSRSVVNVRNNEFFLDPFIRVFTINTTGSVSGDVSPIRDAFPVISVYNSSDTSYALPARNGSFQVRGLTPGTYNVFINASNGYADTTITGVNVTANNNVSIGNIKLHK